MASDRRPAAFSSIDFGQRLRAAREKRGASLRNVSDATKISINILEALEGNDLKRLPGGIFTRSFVKAYAVEVGLDPEETLQQFQHAFPDHAPTPERVPVEIEPDRTPDRRLWPLALAATLLVLAGVAGTAWYRGWRPAWLPAPLGSRQVSAGGMQPLTPAVPDTAARDNPAPVSEAAPTEPPAPTGAAHGSETSATPRDTGASGTDTAGGPVVSAVAPVATPAPTTPAPAANAQAGDSAGNASAGNSPLRLVIQPTGPCWVKVTADGSVQLARLVQPGERLEIDAATLLQVEVGDAGAFAYALDGKPGRPLGSSGRVARVRIDRSNAAGFVTQ